MPSYVKGQKSLYPIYGIMALSAGLLFIIGIQRPLLALFSGIMLIGLFYLVIYSERKKLKAIEEYISTLSYRLKKVGEEALMEMPIGIMLYNDDYDIEWTNVYIASCMGEETLVGQSLYEFSDEIIQLINQGTETDIVTLNDRKYRVTMKLEEKLLYLFDVTEQFNWMNRYEDEKKVISIIYLDNYDDITQGMDDQTKSEVNNTVTTIINKWARDHGIFLKRTSSDRFIAVFTEKILAELEKEKFSVLDDVREATSDQNMSITLSIGVGVGESQLPELGNLAQSSLDLALGRGGDQVAMKLPNGKMKFYGGKTNPTEKRTRVRARVISHALKELMIESDKVVVMGHKFPDMDAVGSSIGIKKVAELNKKEGYIVLNEENLDKGVSRLVEEMKAGHPEMYAKIISPDEALEIMTDQTLLVVVDTHKPSLVIDERLLNQTDRVVVIDHHRRSEDFINKPLLVYMEPYASSTSELVTEMLEYQPKDGKINTLEATSLLSGIIVDTKSFTLRTGTRTFDAASYLRGLGADTVLVQQFLKEDVDTYIRRSKLIETVEFYKEGIAIASGTEDDKYDPVLIAQTADTLLTMDGVSASFVISKRSDGNVGISARSLGEINVQIIMENLGGGGHLTNAAVQLADDNIVEAELKLKQVLDQFLEGRQES